MLQRTFLTIVVVILLAGCSNNKQVDEAIYFIKGRSEASFVQLQTDEALLSIEFVLSNPTQNTVGPFHTRVNIHDEQLASLLENAEPSLFGQTFVLESMQQQGYGYNLAVKKDASVETLRTIIEAGNSLKVEVINESEEIIAAEWIQTFQIVK